MEKYIDSGLRERRSKLKVSDNVLLEDIKVESLSTGAAILMGNNMNGWTEWQTVDGEPVDKYRKIDKK